MSVVGAVVLVAVLVVATALGLVLQRRDGRIRTGTTRTTTPGWDLVEATPAPDDRVLLLQLSSPICAPCERTREQLTALAADHDGVRHVDVDVAERPDVARALHVMRTPTTVAFDRDGTELLRVGGVPRRTDLLAALPLEETR